MKTKINSISCGMIIYDNVKSNAKKLIQEVMSSYHSERDEKFPPLTSIVIKMNEIVNKQFEDESKVDDLIINSNGLYLGAYMALNSLAPTLVNNREALNMFLSTTLTDEQYETKVKELNEFIAFTEDFNKQRTSSIDLSSLKEKLTGTDNPIFNSIKTTPGIETKLKAPTLNSLDGVLDGDFDIIDSAGHIYKISQRQQLPMFPSDNQGTNNGKSSIYEGEDLNDEKDPAYSNEASDFVDNEGDLEFNKNLKFKGKLFPAEIKDEDRKEFIYKLLSLDASLRNVKEYTDNKIVVDVKVTTKNMNGDLVERTIEFTVDSINSINPTFSFKQISGSTDLLKGLKTFNDLANKLGHGNNGAQGQFGTNVEYIDIEQQKDEDEAIRRSRTELRERQGITISYSNTIPQELSGVNLFSTTNPKSRLLRAYLAFKTRFFGSLTNNKDEISLSEKVLRDEVMKLFISDPTMAAKYRGYKYSLAIRKDDLSYAEDINNPQERLALYLNITDNDKPINILKDLYNIADTNINSNINKTIKLTNLKVPDGQSQQEYINEYATLVEAVNKRGEVNATGLKIPSNNDSNLLSVYQPPQQYNKDTDAIKQYRLHINEQYRIGNYNEELSLDELTSVASNMTIMKSLGYIIHTDLDNITGNTLDAYNRDNDTLLSEILANNSNGNTNLNSIVNIIKILNKVQNNLPLDNSQNNNEQKALEEFKNRLKAPLRLPQTYHTLVLKSLGFKVDEYIINQRSDNGKGNYSGNSSVVISPSSSASDKTKEFDNIPSNQSTKHKGSIQINQRAPLTFTEFSKEDLTTSEAKKSMLGASQSVYFYNQTLEYINALEDFINKNSVNDYNLKEVEFEEGGLTLTGIVVNDNLQGGTSIKVRSNGKDYIVKSDSNIIETGNKFKEVKVGKSKYFVSKDTIYNNKNIIETNPKILTSINSIDSIEDTEEIKKVKKVLANAKVALFNLSNPYGFGYNTKDYIENEYPNTGLLLTREVTDDDGNKSIEELGDRSKYRQAISADFKATLDKLSDISESIGLKGLALSQRVNENNSGLPLNRREAVEDNLNFNNKGETLEVDITFENLETTVKVQRKTIIVDIQGPYKNTSYSKYVDNKSMDILVIDESTKENNYTEGKEGGYYLVELDAFDIKEKFKSKDLVTVKIDGGTKTYVRVRKEFDDNTLFSGWYAADGLTRYVGVRLKEGGITVLTANNTLEAIEYANSKHNEFKQSSRQEQLNIINDNATKLFGSFTDLSEDGDKTTGKINETKQKAKIDSLSINNSPNKAFSKGENSFADLDTGLNDPSKLSVKVSHGGIRSNEILELYNRDNYTKEMLEVLDNTETSTTVLFNPIRQKTSTKLNGPQPPLTKTSSLSSKYTINDNYPMFPHMIIDLKSNYDILYNTNVASTAQNTNNTTSSSNNTSNNITTSTKDNVTKQKKEDGKNEIDPNEIKDLNAKLRDIGPARIGRGRTRPNDSTTRKRIDYNSLGQIEEIVYDISQEELIDLYENTIGITPTILTQSEYDKLENKDDKFYVVKSGNRFILPNTEESAARYLGYAGMNINALHTKGGMFSKVVAKHEILHSILNQFMPRARKEKILEATKQLILKDTNRKEKTLEEVNKLSDVELEEYLVLLKEGTEFGKDWKSISNSRVVKTIENSFIGKFISKVLGRKNPVTDFLSWLVTTYKKTINYKNELELLNIDLSNNNFRRTSNLYNNYINLNEDNDINEPNFAQFVGRLDVQIEEKSTQAKRLHKAFSNPFEKNENIAVLDGSIRYDLVEKEVSEKVVAFQFASEVYDLFKERINIGEVVGKLETFFLDSEIDALYDLDLSSKANDLIDKLNDHLSNVNRLKYSEVQLIASELQDIIKDKGIDAFNDEATNLSNSYYALSTISNTRTILNYMFEELEFDSIEDGASFEDGSIDNGQDFITKDATYLSTFDTLSKKVKNHVFNTSYTVKDENGKTKKVFIDSKNAQSFLVKLFQIAQQKNVKGQNNHIWSLQEAWKTFLADKGGNNPNSTAYYEARAVYDKIFKINERFIPIAPNSNYVSNYNYSYSEVAFNSESLTLGNDNTIGLINNENIADSNLLDQAILDNDVDIMNTVIDTVFGDGQDNLGKLNMYHEHFTRLNLEQEFINVLDKYNNAEETANKKGKEFNYITSFQDFLNDIKQLSVDYNDINPAIVQLHQDAFNSITSMFYSNWRVNFSKASLTKNYIKSHVDVGEKQLRGSILAVQTGMLNTVYNTTYTALDENIIKEFIEVELDKDGNRTINNNRNKESKYSLTHDKSSIKIELPFVKSGVKGIFTIELKEEDIDTKGSFAEIKPKALNRIAKQMAKVKINEIDVDITADIASTFYNKIGLTMSKKGIRAFQNSFGIDGVQDMVEHMVHAYSFMQKTHEDSQKIPKVESTLLTALVSRKNDINPYNIVDKSKKHTKNTTDVVKDGETTSTSELKIYSVTRDMFDKVISNLEESNALFKQSSEKNAFYAGKNRYAFDKYTTPLFEHLDALSRMEMDIMYKEIIQYKEDLNNDPNADFSEENERIIELKRQFKFMSSPLFRNKLIEASISMSAEGTDKVTTTLSSKGFSIFNYIENSSSGNGKGFSNLNIKELQRQVLNDFFLYPGKSGNKYGTYHSNRYNEYKQPLEAQANRNMLPLVELNSKVFYDYEGKDKDMLNIPIVEYGLGIKAESELFNVYSNASSYLLNVTNELSSLSKYESNNDLGLFIDNTYLNELIQTTDKLTLASNTNILTPLLIFNTFKSNLETHELNSKDNNQGFKDIITRKLNNSFELLVDQQKELIDYGYPLDNKLIEKLGIKIQYLNNLLTTNIGSLEINRKANELAEVYKETYLNRFKESFVMLNEFYVNKAGVDQDAIKTSNEIINNLKIEYNDIIENMSNLDFNYESLLESDSYLRINETLTDVDTIVRSGYANNTEESIYVNHIPLPSPKLHSMLNNEIMAITNSYNNQLYEIKKDKDKFNKLKGQLTPNRHFDGNNNVTIINGIVGFNTELALDLYEKSLDSTISFNAQTDNALQIERESIRNDIKSKLALLNVLKGLGINRKNLNDIVNKKIDVHEEYLKVSLNKLDITTDGSYTELLKETLDGLDVILESKGINEVVEAKIPTIGKYLYTNASESFDSYISTLKTEMVRFGLQSIEQEVEFTGLTKTIYNEDTGKATAPIKQKESNDRYNKMLLDYTDSYFEDLGEGLVLVENTAKEPIEINVNGKLLKDYASKKFVYTETNSNSARRTNTEPTLNAGSYLFFSNDTGIGSGNGIQTYTKEERLELFKQADIDTQLDNINPIILDFFLTNKVNGTYLSQYIDGDIYRYKGSDVTAKIIDEIKRIGTNTTPGTKPVFREITELSNQVAIIEGKKLNPETNKFEDNIVGYNTVTDTVVINNNGLSINHNIANVPDEVYDVMKEEYKYFRDVSASTHESDYLALDHIKRNLLHYGTLSKAEVNRLSVSNLIDLKKTDSSSKDNKGLYIRKNAKYTINSKGNIELLKDNEGIIIGKSGEDIKGFEAWDGATFMSNLMGMLIINSYGNKEGIDMTQQGLKMINNNMDAKSQNGVSMKSLQVKFTAKFAFDASPQVKAMIKEGYRTGVLDEDFSKKHTYLKGTIYEKVTRDPLTDEETIEELTLPYDLEDIEVNDGEWDIDGNFIAPKLRMDEDGNRIKGFRYKNLYDVYWENGGWNPNEKGEFETVYFDGTTKPATKETNATTKVSKADFEVFKAYVKNREISKFMIKDKKTNEFLNLETYRDEFNISDDLSDEQVILKIQASEDFVYMDSVMLFNPGSGTKKGARTSNPNFIGYKGEFDNIVSQPMENFSYIITINKKDKPGQDVALSSQFTYLLGMEDNVFEAQSIYDAIAELSKEKRSEFDSKIERTKKDLIKRGAVSKIKDTLYKMSGASDLVDNLSPKVISVLIQHRLVNSKASSLDMNRLTKDNMVDLFNEISDTTSLTEIEIDVLAEAILEMTAVKRYMMDIVKANAEASSDFNQVWEHVANQNDVDEMAISNPVLFNKLFSDVAARVSKGMSLRVNGKKAVQMPISQMKKLMIYKNKAYVRTDLFKLFKKENPSKTNQEVFKMINDKIVDKEIIERSVRYGNPDQDLDKITHTEVEAANPMMLKYSFLKDLSMRDIFDIDIKNKTLSLEANTFEEIENVVENLKDLFTKLEQTKDSIKVNGKDVIFDNILKADTTDINTLANSSFGTMLLEDAQSTLKEFDKIEALTKYEKTTLMDNEEAIQEAKEIYENRLTKRIQRLEQELNSIEVEDREKKVSKLQNALSERESIESMSNEQLATYIKTSVNYDVSQHNEAKNTLMFIEALREGKDFEDINEALKEIVGSGSKKLLEKLYKEYYNNFTNSVKYTNRSLYGIMSRVPNTGLNSNSFFKIMSFNNEYGNSVFIPAEWLDISGSDHDGDTLQLWQLDPYGKNKSSDKALEKASKIMTKYNNTSVIFSKLDLSLKPIQDAATAKYSKPGMYLKHNDAWSLFNIIFQNGVGSTVVGTAALLGKNFTYSNQVVKTLVEFLNTQMDARNLENIDDSITLENEINVVIETSVDELQDIYDMLGDALSIVEYLTEDNYTKEDIAQSLNVVDISVELKGDILELLCL